MIAVNTLDAGLADVGQFTERLDPKLLLVVDVAGGGVELVVPQQSGALASY